MSHLRLSLITVNQIPLDLTGNRQRIEKAITLTGHDRQVICFPELSLTGYGCEDAFYMPYLIEGARKSLLRLAANTAQCDALIATGLPFRHNDLLYNCMALIYRGRVVALIPKQHLAGEGLHYEQRWFRAFQGQSGSFISSKEQALDGAWFGPALIDFAGIRIAIEICEDAWVMTRPALKYALASTDLILNPAASHFGFGKYAIRNSIVEASSREFHCIYATVNLLGNEAGKAIYDGSRIVASDGTLLHQSQRFSYCDAQISQLELPLQGLRQKRRRLFSRKEEMNDDQASLQILSIDAKSIQTDSASTPASLPPGYSLERIQVVDDTRPTREKGAGETEQHRFEEFLQAETLALYDYMRKSGAQGYTVSLSGGADSAACALLVERMIRRGMQELGDYFFSKAGLPVYPPSNATAALLHTIYQSTAQSSKTTERAASAVATELQSDHHCIHIQDIVDRSIDMIEETMRRKLSWETDDLVLQNIQARMRSPLVWMMANMTGSILITTGNRSEGAVGYCTMDGDTSGGLAPLAGIDKAFLLRWLRHMETTGDDFGPVPSLQTITGQKPTAELRPPEAGQTDEKDLMPYPLLERIERLALQDLMPPSAIVDVLHREQAEGLARWTESGSFNRDELVYAVSRFFKLWRASQWKRERLAVSFHIDSYNIDPRSYLRFPVLSTPIQGDSEE